MSTKPKRTTRSRKRKISEIERPSSPEPSTSPKLKRRKISHKRNSTKKPKDDKSQSVEPSIKTSKNTSNKSNLRRYSTHTKNYDSDHAKDENDDDFNDKESSSEQSPDSTTDPVPHRTITRSQPSTPIRPNRTNYKVTPHQSQSAKKSRTTQRRYIRNGSGFTLISSPHNNSNIYSSPSQYSEYKDVGAREKYDHNKTPTNLYECDCGDAEHDEQKDTPSYDAEYDDDADTPPPATAAVDDNDRKQTPDLGQSQDSIEFSVSPKVTPSRKVDTSMISQSYSTVIPVNPTPLRTAENSYGGNSDYNNGHIPFACPPQPSFSAYAGMSGGSQQSLNGKVFGTNERLLGNGNVSRNHNKAYVQDNNDDDEDSKRPENKHDIFSIKFWESVFKRYSVIQTVMFVAIGVVIGLIVSRSVQYQNQLSGSTPIISTQLLPGNVITHTQDTCTCDITQNKSSILCNPCMDQYWSLKEECTECEAEQKSLKNKNEQIRAEIAECKSKETKLERQLSGLKQCDSKRKQIKFLHEQCMTEKQKLQNRPSTNIKCGDKQKRIDELEHELGECNVEWGACEQEGRQKDKLDEKRVEEIEKQKEKFTLCNNQLKKYKQEAKQRKKQKSNEQRNK